MGAPRQRHLNKPSSSQATIATLIRKQLAQEEAGNDNTAVVVKLTSFGTPRFWIIGLAALLAVIGGFYGLTSSNSSDLGSNTRLGGREPVNAAGDSDTASFLSWFQTNGGRASEQLSIASCEGMGRGIVARGSIDEHDELLFVPMDLIICRETIWKHASSKLLAKYEKLRDSPTELLTAFLLLEQFKDSSSFWYPYLRILPAYPSSFRGVASPLFFESDDDILELQDGRVIQAAAQERQQAQVAFRRFRRLFKNVLPADSSLSSLLQKRYTWARFLINSRAFSIRGDRFLVPFGDIFNGKPQPKERASLDGNGLHFLEYHRLHVGAGMEIRADRAVAIVGQQVFEDYGDNDNYVYFVYHGFILEKNPFDCAAIELPTTNSDPKKQLVLEEHSQNHGGAALVCVTSSGQVRSFQEQQTVKLFASVKALESDLAQVLCSSREYQHLCIGCATFAQQNQLLVGAIRQQLHKYATTEDEDRTMLANETMPVARRHVIRFRQSRTQILNSALLALEQKQSVQAEQRPIAPQFSTENCTQELSTDNKIQRFTSWIGELAFPINHVELKYVNPAMGYGTFATKSLTVGEVYLSVPTELIMDAQSSLSSHFIRDLLVETRHSGVRWTESQLLLLHLIHEKFAPTHASFWRPYLDILPEHDRLGSPLFYDPNGPELDILHDAVPLDLWRLVRAYRHRVEMDFERLLSDTPRVPDWLTRERFRWATAILDSRSIWWSGTRHLVPLLDMVNCVELSEEHTPHTTRLAEKGDAAITQASWRFDKGDQIVENYGQPNHIYLLYHGFVLHDNSYDCALFHFELDKARLLPSHDVDRRVVIAAMESMQLRSWSQDVCIGGQKETGLDKFLRLALIAKSPKKAADVERHFKGEITREHIDAATKVTTDRLARLELTIAKHDSDDRTERGTSFKMVMAYVKQQLKLMETVLTLIESISLHQ